MSVIIGCSIRRSDSHDAIEILCNFAEYNTNAYVIHFLVNFDVCGASMVLSLSGNVLRKMKGKFGMETVEFNPKNKYCKPTGFGNPEAPLYEYIEFERKPWLYRVAGSSVIKDEHTLGYPRVCAHRGFNTIAPENSMPAFGAAIALGAEEIEFDLWPTADGEIVSCHDRNLERVSTGTGFVTDCMYKELEQFDFGVKFNEKFKGLRIIRFEDILRKFACQTIMNVHVKPLSHTEPYPEEIMKRIVALVKKYNCEKYVYFMLSEDIQIKQFKEYAPQISVCVGHLDERPWAIVDRAIEFGCEKVQLFKPYLNQEMIDKAHSNGIICNVFFSDDPKETKHFLNMGIDTILTNDYNLISQSVGRKV